MHGHIWERGHYLLFRRQICTLFELKVADGSAQCQIAIDSSKINETTSRAYTRLLPLVLRLVIK